MTLIKMEARQKLSGPQKNSRSMQWQHMLAQFQFPSLLSQLPPIYALM